MTLVLTPKNLDEAISMLAESPGLTPLAGCTDFMVQGPEHRHDLPGVIDLLGVPELCGIQETAAGLSIGATTTFTEIGRSPLVQNTYPALAAAAKEIGGWQIQNRATLGGNIANASPAGDSLPVLLVLEADAILLGPAGERRIPYTQFHKGYRQTVLAPGEIIARVELPAPPPESVQLFRKVGTRDAQAISKVVVALLALPTEGRLAELRLAVGSVAPIPIRLETVEQAVAGRVLGVGTADLAGELATEAVTPIDDVRSTAAYRRWVTGRIVRRMMLSLL